MSAVPAVSRPFWWSSECNPEDEPEEPELTDEEADRVERDASRY